MEKTIFKNLTLNIKTEPIIMYLLSWIRFKLVFTFEVKYFSSISTCDVLWKITVLLNLFVTVSQFRKKKSLKWRTEILKFVMKMTRFTSGISIKKCLSKCSSILIITPIQMSLHVFLSRPGPIIGFTSMVFKRTTTTPQSNLNI